eukprot:822004-Pyramimonas_sp.AAC.1
MRLGRYESARSRSRSAAQATRHPHQLSSTSASTNTPSASTGARATYHTEARTPRNHRPTIDQRPRRLRVQLLRRPGLRTLALAHAGPPG